MKRFNELKNRLIIKLVLTFSLILFSVLLNKPIVYAAGTEFDFNYTGDYQTFVAPKTGVYKLETWGAQGGHRGSNNGGKGGYTSGTIYLTRGDILYVYVGGNGTTNKGYNGGGLLPDLNIYGGGATDIRLTSGAWDSEEGLKTRLIVSGGGGSVGSTGNSGGAGGLSGVTASSGYGSGGGGATIAAAGLYRASFGKGGNGLHASGGYSGAGGGGFFGGGGANPDGSGDDDKGGGGGSSFAYNAQSKSNYSSMNIDEKYYMNSISYSTGTNAGDGKAKITLLEMNGITDVQINNGDVPVNFSYDRYDYDFTVNNDTKQIKFDITTEDGYTLSQSNKVTDMTNVLSVTNTVTLTDNTTGLVQVYTFKVKKHNYYLNAGGGTSYYYDYTGDYQTFYAYKSGVYKLETWGAQGGDRGASNGGKGGYTSGEIYLNKGEILYIYVGGNGNNHNGYNGGGYIPETCYSDATCVRPVKVTGGGATDIRLVPGTWDNTDGLNSRIMVAGGGGSVGAYGNAGGAGGLTGGSTSGCGSGGVGASITAAGSYRASFGKGGNGLNASGGYAGSGGGGFFGGGGANPDGSGDDDRGGGGGSSFAWSNTTKTSVPSSYNVSEKYFINAATYTSGSNSGDGKAKITLIKSNGITDIKINRGNIPIDFNYEVHDYYLNVDNDMTNVRFNVATEEGYTVNQTNKIVDMTNILSFTNTITLTDNTTGVVTTYNVTIRKQNSHLEEGSTASYGYSYTGNYEKFYVPATGIYSLETWGAQGSDRGAKNGGKGGYSYAEMYLSKGEVLYVHVGGSGNTTNINGTGKGYNGGGQVSGYYGSGGVWIQTSLGYGGGASDIRYGGDSLYNRVIVAGGGGSVGASGNAGGAGGGLTGENAIGGYGAVGTGGTQTSGGTGQNAGSFGQGGNSYGANGGYGGAGGGGWYGGGGSGVDSGGDDDRSGAGGSGFIWSESSASNVPSGYLVTDKSYLSNGLLYSGNQTFKSPTGANETGHTGDGFVRITPKLINGVSSVTINDGDIPVDFDYSVYDYDLSVLDSVDYINVSFILNEGYSKVESHKGAYYFKDGEKKYVYAVDVTNNITGLTVTYTFTFHKQSDYLLDDGNYGYKYTGSWQKFIAPATGIYTLEAWGAQGGHRGNNNGGKGGYSTGQIFLNRGQILYVYVGGDGNNHKGYNGGGLLPGANIYGGGASDIRSGGYALNNRILVAGGGGSVGSSSNAGGYGGGLTGGSGNGSFGTLGTGGTQTKAGTGNISGSFGQGGNGVYANSGFGGAGGGGWYGGGGSGVDGGGDDDRSGAGGSGFIWTESNKTIVPEDYLPGENVYLTEAKTVSGNSEMPTPKGETETGHSGDGYVKISFALSYDYQIKVSDNVKVDKEFDYKIKDYTGTLDSNDSSLVTFTVTDSDSIINVTGDGTREIHVGDNDFEVAITYVNGVVDIFTYHIHREANNIDYLNNIYLDDKSVSEFGNTTFNKNTYEYNLTLPYYMDEYDLTVDKGSSDQIITNLGHISNKNNKYTIPISVTNETGTSTKIYTLNITLPHSSKMKKLTLTSDGGTKLEYDVPIDETTMDINLESHIAAVHATTELYDSEAKSNVLGDGYIQDDEYTITITVTEPHVSSTVYTINIKRITVSGYEKDVSYTGSYQTVVIPYDHEYFLQAWGAQGGNNGGRGGYSYGTAYLEKGTILYVYTGGSGQNGGFNGGGDSRVGKGGGASDIRVGTDSLYSRILVAGGGGGHGSDGCASGAVGGGLKGGGSASSGSCGTQAGGGTQTEGGSYGIYGKVLGSVGKFGVGASSSFTGGSYYGGAGGGGWYGGGSGSTSGWSNGGGGGSGFVYTKDTASVIEGNSDWLLDSTYYLTNAETLSGSNDFIAPSGDKEETGHPGNGMVKISIPYQESENNYLDGIIVNKGTLTPSEWDYNKDTYYLDLASDEVEINVEGVPADGKASVIGNGDYVIEGGETKINLVVTAENGSTKTYTLVVHRELDTNPIPNSIEINGLIKTYCEEYEGACNYTFNKDIHNYEVTVPYTIREITMVVDKAHYFQTTKGDGVYALSGGKNNIKVEVTSEDKKNTSEWNYEITRDMTGNADLKSLKVIDPEVEINYSYNITDYYITVPKDTEHVTLEAIPDDENATVKIENPETLEYGDNLITITVTAANKKVKEYHITVNRLQSNNAFLNNFKVINITNDKNEELSLTPEFNKMNLSYELEVENDITKLRLEGVAEDTEFSSIEGLGDFDIKVGANTFNVVVTAQDKTFLTYKLNVKRKANSNTLLDSLTVKDHNFTENFESNKYLYYMYVDGNVESLDITAVPSAETSTYQIIGNYQKLVAGKNEITVRVTAEDKSTCDYKIIVYRTGYSDNNLESLTVTNGSENYILSPNFDPLYDKYTLTLPNDVSSVTLTAVANGQKRAKIGSSAIYVKKIDLLKENPSNNVITVTAEDGTIHTYTVDITREISSDNTLQSLEVKNNTFTPDFDKNTLNYTLTTYDTSLDILAVPTNKFAKVSISNNRNNLKEGLNTITIDVTSENGKTKTYTLDVTLLYDSNNYLKSLNTSDGLNEEFNKEKLDYTATTEKDEITITPLAESTKAIVKITNSKNETVSGPTLVSAGENIFNITVTAQNGDVRTYKLNVTKVPSTDSKLSSLTTNEGLNETFDPEKLDYTLNTKSHEITILPVVRDKHSSYKILDSNNNEITDGKVKLVTGDNRYSIVVTAEDLSTTTYTLTVTRTKNNVATIESVGFGTTPKFDKNTFNYDTVTDETSLDFSNIVLTDPYSTYEITGNSDFTNDKTSTVTVKVKSEDEKVTNTYTFNVTKVVSTDSSLKEFKLGDYEFVPEFNKDTKEYEVFVPKTLTEEILKVKTTKNTAIIKSITVNSNSLTLTSDLEYNSKITGLNPVKGDTITVIVEAENKTQSTYTLKVSNEDEINNYLSTLNVSCGELTPAFNKDTNEYTVMTTKDVTEFTVLATPEVTESTVTGNGTYSFNTDKKKQVVEIKVKSKRGSERIYKVTVRRPASNESRLNNLTVINGVMTPNFQSETYEYDVTVPSLITELNKDSFTYELMDEDAKISFPSMKLNVNEVNKYEITVTSEDETSVTKYILNVTKEASNSTTISSVHVNALGKELTCEVNQDTKTCEITIPADATSFVVSADIPYGASINPENKTSYNMDITEKEKDITLNVTAENKINTDSYTLKILREKSNNAFLSSLEVNYTSVKDFKSDVLSYEETVIGTLSQVFISASTKDPRATIKTDLSNTFKLNPGDNNIDILVEAEDGTKKTYTVNVIRSTNEDATLKSLSVNGYKFSENFDPDETEYTVLFPRDKTELNKTEISYELSDPIASISMDSKLSIDYDKQYNTFNITVTAGDGVTKKTYHINVKPIPSTNNEVDHIVINGDEVKDVEGTFTYSIFDTDTEATLSEIVLKNEYASIFVLLPQNIKADEDFTFVVTAEDGSIKTYTIKLIQNKTRELNLQNIEVNFKEEDDCDGICTLDKTFDENVLDYEIYIPNELNSLESLIVTPKNNLQNVVIKGNENFVVGENIITIVVSNSLSETKEYKLHVIKEANSDPNLLGISFKIPEQEIEGFDENTTEYNVEFTGLTTGKYELEYTKKFDGQRVKKSGATVLNYGNNNIIVTSKSESCFSSVKTRKGCNEKSYVIHAYRNEVYSNLLSALTISTGNESDLLQTFNKYKFDYVLEVDSEISKIKVEGTAFDSEHASVEGNGEYNLKLGDNEIKITVVPIIGGKRTYTINVVRSSSDNVNLSDLKVEGHTMTPSFSKTTLDYYVSVDSDVNSLDVKYTKEDPNSSVVISGNDNLVTGENVIRVVVLSQDKTRGKTYKIHAFKAASDENKLNNIKVSSKENDTETEYNLEPKFDPEKNEYNVNIPSNINIVNVDVTKKNIMETVTGIGTYALKYGTNKVTIVVTSESGIINNYTLNINREYELGLSDLIVKDLMTNDEFNLTPEFESSTLEYNVTVPYETEDVFIEGTLIEPDCNITGLGAHALNTGENTVNITVSYKDEASKTYVLNITREKNNDNNLLSLKVEEGIISPVFDKDTLNYEVTIPYEFTSATIDYTLSDPNASVEIINNSDFEVGISKDVIVRVTAENGDVKDYIIKVTRDKMPDASNYLSYMAVDNFELEPEFTKKNLNYEVDVPKDTTNITLHLKADDPRYTTVSIYKLGESAMTDIDVTQKDPSINLDITSKDTTFVIRVTNYQGITRNYQLLVYRLGDDEARIKSLSFNHGELSPKFDRDKFEYTLEVDRSINAIKESVIMLAEDSTYTIIGNKNLKPGNNTVLIKTLSADKTTSLTYTITVIKKLSSNAYLKDIVTYPDKTFTFNKEDYTYNMTVPKNVNSIQIIGIREDNTSTITGNGVYNITGNELMVNLVVTAEDGTSKIYTVTFTKEKDDNANLAELIIDNGELVPEFNPDTLEYNVKVENYIDSIRVTGKAESDSSTVTGFGEHNLDVGTNKITITVTSESGNKKDYIINVTRKSNTRNTLESLVISDENRSYALNPEFDKDTENYTVELPRYLKEVTVTAKAEDESSTVTGTGLVSIDGKDKIVVTVTSESGEEKTYIVDIIRVKSSIAYIKSLVVKNGEIDKEFDKKTYDYTVNVNEDVTSLDMDITLEDPNSSYEVIGNKNLSSGENIIKIKVTSEDGNTTKLYTVKVIKGLSTNNNLSMIKVNGNNVENFNKNTLEYNLTVENSTEFALIEYIKENIKSTVKGDGTYSLVEGENIINITVASESGNEKTYKLNIYRKYDDTLKSIETNRGEVSPTFNKNITEYTLTLPNSVKDINVKGIASSKESTVDGNNTYDLLPGENTITLTVTTKDNNKKTYTLIVTRETSDNNYLSRLSISEGVLSPTFNKDKTDYTSVIPNEYDHVTIDYETMDKEATVQIIGNENLVEGENTITVRVTSTSKKVRDYVLTITKQAKENYSNYLTDLSVDPGELDPVFNKKTNTYNVTVPNSASVITVSGVRESNEATVNGFGRHELSSNRTEIFVTVTSKDKKIRTYKIIVNKLGSSEARLKNLMFEEGVVTPVFNKNIYEYNMVIPSNVKKLTPLLVTTIDKDATYEIIGNENLNASVSTVIVRVTAPDKITKKDYKITVNKEVKPIARLLSLTSNVGELTPEFDKDNSGVYEIDVDDSINSIILSGEKEYESSIVSGLGIHYLTDKETNVIVTVTSETGYVMKYAVKIVKSNSSNAYLSDLGVKNNVISPEFDKNTNSYKLTVTDKESSIEIYATPENPSSTVDGTGIKNLDYGLNTFNIVVTSANGNTNTYAIEVTREYNESVRIKDLIVKEGELTPEFDPDTLEYSINIPNEKQSLSLNVTLEDPNSSYEIIGNENFVLGENKVQIKVTGKSGKTNTYVLNVNRQNEVNNYLKNITLSDGKLTPEFDKTTLSYDVTVGENVDSINVSATVEDEKSTLTGDGIHSLVKGKNKILLKVVNSGIERVYTLNILREYNSDNKLISLTTDKGSLTPEFNPDINNYVVDVDENTDNITVNATANPDSLVTGTGNYLLNKGENTITITVTAEDGSINTYVITVNKALSSNLNLTKFEPDTGTLDKEYNNNENTYTLNVGSNISIINMSIIPEDSRTTISGEKVITMNESENTITYTLTAEDNSTRVITLNVVREEEVTDLEIDKTNIVMVEGETDKINVKVLPISVNTKVLYEVLDKDIIEVDEDGNIKALTKGFTKIIVSTEKNPAMRKEVTVEVLSSKITSSVYNIARVDYEYITGMDENDTIKDLLSNVDNESSTLKVYNSDLTEITDLDEVIKTGQVIKLIINGKVYDELYIVLKGDINGDGLIDVTDKSKLKDHILLRNEITDYTKYAADLNNDGLIDVSDNSKIADYILMRIDTLN